MLVCIPLAWMWLLPNEFRRFSISLVAVSTFSSNVLFYLTSGYFEGDLKPLLHTWSLAVEEQYYVIFPVFILLTWNLGKRWIIFLLSVVCLLSFAAAQWFSIVKPEFGFLLLPTRLWELGIGVLVAFYLAEKNGKTRSQTASAIGVMLIVYSVVAFDRNTPFPGIYALLPTIGTALVILFATQDTWIGRILGNKVLVGMGLISYSAYLWHQPLFAFAKHRSIEEPGIALQSALAVAALVLAYFSWRFVETPFRNRNRFSRHQVFLYGALLSGICIAIGLIGYVNDGFEDRVSPDVLSVHIVREHIEKTLAAGCKLYPDGFRLKECIKGDKTVPPRYALIGDSHAQALTFELSAAFERNKLSFIPYVRSACALNFHMTRFSGDDDDRKCVLYQDEIEKGIDQNEIQTYIIYSRRDQPLAEPTAQKKAAFEEHLKSINKLLDLGKRVILVYPTPVHKVFVSDYMAKNLWFYGNRHEMIYVDSALFEKRIKYFRDGYDALGIHPNLARVYASEVFCDSTEKDKCVTQINGVPLYFDQSHLSDAGARLVTEKIMQKVVQ